jgi:tellurite resistance protein TerC
MTILFPFAEYWWFYAGFTAFVVVLLLLDLGLFHRKDHAVGFREASLWTLAWMGLAAVFGALLYHYTANKFDAATASRILLEFATGYVVEESLSVDNMFVFVLVFQYFGIPPKYQHRVLFFGILGALFFRAVFIAIGSALIQYNWVLFVFGAFLVYTGYRMFRGSPEDLDPGDSPAIRIVRRLFPVTEELHGHSFFTRIHGRLHATPLFLTLMVLEMTDIVFAVDSVPAVFAVTREPLIVFTSNIFAILGLRSLYFLLAGAVGKFHLLHYGLAIVLVFVGLKMTVLNWAFGGHFPIGISLAVILSVVGGSIALSLLYPKKAEEHVAPEVVLSDNEPG